MKNFFSLLLLFLVILTSCKKENNPVTYYVAPYGADENPGTRKQPFSSLEKAKTAIKAYRKEHDDMIKKNFNVVVLPGTYQLKSTFRLHEEDGGMDSLHTITYKALDPGQTFIMGGITLDTSLINHIEGSSLEKAFNANLRDSIVYIDLKKAGIHDYGKMVQHGFSIAIQPSPMELFINNKDMQLARWPNDTLVPILKVIRKGSVPRDEDTTWVGGIFRYDFGRDAIWKHTKNAWAYGFFSNGYADDNIKIKEIDTVTNTISLVQPHMYGVSGIYDEGWTAPFRKFRVYNFPEELDKPGEYYLDRDDGKIYFYPPGNEEITKVQVSMTEAPLISLLNVSNIIFKDFVFECSRGMAFYFDRGENVKIKNCTFRNLGTVAIMNGQGIEGTTRPIHDFTGTPVPETIGNIKAHLYKNTTWNRLGGKNHIIENCKIYQTGTGGILLSGGNRLSLTPGNNIIQNCEIYSYNRINTAYCPAIHVDGVGNQAINCYIHDAPNQGIALFGNEHLVDSCVFERVCMEANDMGAIYMGRNPTERGNIVQHSFFNKMGKKDDQSVAGIYLDDMACGMEIFNNVFYEAGKGHFSAVVINNGSDIPVHGNLFIDSEIAVKVAGAFGTIPKKIAEYEKHTSPDGIYYTRLHAVNYDEEPYRSAYPELLDFFEKNYGIPKRNPIYNNVVIRTKTFGSYSHMKEEDYAYDNIVLNDSTINKEEVLEEIKSWIKEENVDHVIQHGGRSFEELYNQK